jgi:pimeloyl-ACP methyl ester carboxylesterase
VYDKRGVGASTGDWLKSGFEDLAEDALAAVQLLQSRPEISSKQIGLWGASQGGWIVALAASRSRDVAFIISQSGPGVTPHEQELYRTEAWLRADGFADEPVQKALALVRRRYECARTDTGWEMLAAAEREAKEEPWYPYTGGPAGRDHSFWGFWRLIRDYDPAPALEQVRCPVLAMFGGVDTYLPVEKSMSVWKNGLEKAGNRDVTIKLFPKGDHALFEAKTGGLRESSRLKTFVPGYFSLTRDWVLKRVRVKM